MSAAETVGRPALFTTSDCLNPTETKSSLHTWGKRDLLSAPCSRRNTRCKTHTEECDERAFLLLVPVRRCHGNGERLLLPDQLGNPRRTAASTLVSWAEWVLSKQPQSIPHLAENSLEVLRAAKNFRRPHSGLGTALFRQCRFRYSRLILVP